MFRKRSYIGRVTDTATAAHPEGFDISVTCTMAKSETRHTGLARALRTALTAGALGGLVTQAHAAMITVNTVADNLSADTFCSLREAIDNVNHASTLHSDCTPVGSYGPDTIVFDSTVFPPNGLTAIVVTSELVLEPSTVTTIDGGGVVAIDGGGTTRLFRTAWHSNSAFHALTIRNGYYAENGIGFYNAYGATTVLDQSTISGNRSPLAGGGIENDGSMTLTNCAITNNIAYTRGGGILNYGGTLVLTNSTVSGNRTISSYFGGGGIKNENAIVHNLVGTLTLSNSTLSGNTAPYG